MCPAAPIRKGRLRNSVTCSEVTLEPRSAWFQMHCFSLHMTWQAPPSPGSGSVNQRTALFSWFWLPVGGSKNNIKK